MYVDFQVVSYASKSVVSKATKKVG